MRCPRTARHKASMKKAAYLSGAAFAPIFRDANPAFFRSVVIIHRRLLLCNRTAFIRAIYIAQPKAGADQNRGCTGPDAPWRAGFRDVHVGGLVGQRRDQIHYARGYESLNCHTTGALLVFLSQPPACLPTLPSNSIESAQTLGDIYLLSWLTRKRTVTARRRASNRSM